MQENGAQRSQRGEALGISSTGTDPPRIGRVSPPWRQQTVRNKRTFVKDLDSGVEGKPTKLRYIEVQVSPTAYTYQAEASIDGGPWTVIAEGKVTKVR